MNRSKKPTQKMEDWVDIVRASGDCVCEQCGKTYREHPYDERFWEEVGYGNGRHYWANKLCDGTTVKL